MLKASELNGLINAITETAYKVGGVLNQHLDAGDLTQEQEQALRLAAASLCVANQELWPHYVAAREAEAAK
jgi:hypothetical protein